MCETRHLGLDSINKTRYYFSLIKKYQYYRYLWKKKKSKKNENFMNAAKEKIEKYEQQQNINKKVFYNNVYADKKYFSTIQNFILERNK